MQLSDVKNVIIIKVVYMPPEIELATDGLFNETVSPFMESSATPICYIHVFRRNNA